MMKSVLRATVFALFATAAQGAVYFVAPEGNDLAGGTELAPWRTLQRAANAVAPGDRVIVRPGDYAGFYLSRSGSASAPIEFVAEPGAVITQPNATTPDGINLERASYVTIDGFTVTGMTRAGIRSVGSSTQAARFVTVRNVHAYDNGRWGIFTGFVDDLLIESSITSGAQIEHGIYVSNSGDRPVVRDNLVFGNRANGIHMNGDRHAGGDGVITGALVSGNVIFGNGAGGGSGVNMDGVQNSRIENNLLYNNTASGISLYRIDGAQASTGNIVVNNTVHQPAGGRWALNIQNASTGNTVLNNILLNEHSFRGAIDISADSLSGFVSDHNVMISRFTTNGGSSVMSLSQWQSQTGNDAHSHVANAGSLFLDAASGDYHLRAMAVAIDSGTSLLAPTADVDRRLRPLGLGFDIGAYEFAPIATIGDYNDDGVVDAADYVIWRRTLGQNVAMFTGADGNGDGVIGPADYDLWRENFGVRPAANVVSVSEPDPNIVLSTGVILMAIQCLQLYRRCPTAASFCSLRMRFK